LLASGLVLLCLGVLAAFYYWHERRITTPEAMVACLPPRDATLVYVDVCALRRAGILDLLAGSKATEDLEYKSFVQATGFDYRRDLDSVAAAFAPDGTYLVVKGRFDWKNLNRYAQAQGGRCINGFCATPGSAPERRGSFYALKPNTMALAFGRDEFAAGIITSRGRQPGDPLPQQPIWVSVPGAALRRATDLPAGTHSFATALASADKIVFSAGPEQDHLQVQMTVNCATPDAAAQLGLRLDNVTDLLRKMVTRENQTPNTSDLSGVLAAGTFQTIGSTVFGRWPVERAFLDSLAEGSLN
ncbi:MAG: hypothetical protein ACRD9L_11245, partial [Bryobacteraceae bacterium]